MNENKKVPSHVAIIMDGNGRWAQLRGLERAEGHVRGVESVRKAIRTAAKCGVNYLTLYAFSTENWGRPTAEVDALMELMCMSIVNETPQLKSQGVRVRVIGDKSRFSQKVQQHLQIIESETNTGETLTVVLALNYSSRDEMRRAITTIAQRVESGELKAEEVNEELISKELDTAFMPDPDLIIRTSGECRLSNFLLWQAAYAEFYFPEVLWPDFDEEEFDKALEVYASRERRFGKL